MPTINIGNVVGLIRSQTPPAKKYVLWGKIINPVLPDLVELNFWDELSTSWVPLVDPTHQYWLRPAISDEETAPPGAPANGDRYLIPSGASGAWSGKTDQVATWSAANSAWLYTIPLDGNYISVRIHANTLFDYRGEYGAGGIWVESDFQVPIAPGTYIPSTEKDAALGVAALDASSKISLAYILHNDIPYEPTVPLNWPAGTDTIKKALDHLVGLSSVNVDRVWRDMGPHDATGNVYPTTGGSGGGGAIKQGDTFEITIADPNPTEGFQLGLTLRALEDSPGSNPSKWRVHY